MASFFGTVGSDVLDGGAEDDTVDGAPAGNPAGDTGSDRLSGDVGADSIFGRGGDDVLIGGAGNDTMDGGAGFDVVGYDWEEHLGGSGVTVNLGTGTATDTFGNTDTLVSIEAVSGTTQADTLIGSNNDASYVEEFYPDGGVDSIDGLGGIDHLAYGFAPLGTSGITVTFSSQGSGTVLDYGGAIDTFSNIEGVQGTRQADTFNGSDGEETFQGLSGDDTFNGGLGFDTVDYFGEVPFGGGTQGISVNLALGTGTDAFGNTDTLTSIERVIGTPLADSIVGDSASNRFDTDAGNDTLVGGAGDDTMVAGAGDDTYEVTEAGDQVIENPGEGSDTVWSGIDYTLAANVETLFLAGSGVTGTGNGLDNYIDASFSLVPNNVLVGGAGDDTMVGGAGDDIYEVTEAGDQVVENPGEGSDTVWSGIDYTLAANVETLFLAGTGVRGTGNGLDNYIDASFSLVPNNILIGGTGTDTMVGGAGDDIYEVGEAGDQVVENPGEGSDTVWSGIDYTLPANVETLFLAGTGVTGTGNGLDNYIDASFSLVPNNILIGGTGTDTMVGGAGDDIYEVTEAGDQVVENPGEGSDTVWSGIDYTLAANVETLFLAGTGVRGTGNGLDNVIDASFSLVPNNVLVGGTGTDTMRGGAGDDIYEVTEAGDQVIENPGEGSDTVWSGIDYTLAANVETLFLAGSGVRGTGNGLANVIDATFSSLANVLDGAGGADFLTGGAENDTFVFRRGEANGDVVVDFAGNGAAPGDVLQFVDYGAGATFTQLDATHWQIHSGDGLTHETITFQNAAAVHPSDILLV